MRIELSSLSKKNLSENDQKLIIELANKSIHNIFLLSVESKGAYIVLECVNEEYVSKIRNLFIEKYSIKVSEDCFMAEIDLIDMLTGGLW